MTDTIGWGDVEVEPRRRRLRRRMALVVWPVVVVLVAAVAVVPTLRARFADAAAGWLAGEWAKQQAVDDARTVALEAALSRIGPGDLRLYAQLVRALDLEDASRLTQLEDAVGAHRTWASDVSRAAATARSALQAEVGDLRREAGHIETTGLVSSAPTLPTPFAESTFEVVLAADRLVARVARAHSQRTHPAAPTRLTAGAAILHTLAQVTDRPLPFRLAIADSDGVVQWDLTTGTHQQVTHDDLQPVSTVLPFADGALLVTTDSDTTWLLPVDGSPPHRLPAHYAYVPDGRGGLWRVGTDAAQRITATGAPYGATRPLPPGFVAEAGENGPGSGLVVVDQPDANTVAPSLRLWSPDTGRLTPAVATCTGVSSTPDVGVYSGCDDTLLRVLDLRTGRTREVPVPGATPGAIPVISPDGSMAAIAFGATDSEGAPEAVAVVDLHSGHDTVIRDDFALSPMAWSPDGSTLILAGPDGGSDALAYWQPGMSGVASIRIRVGPDGLHIGVMP